MVAGEPAWAGWWGAVDSWADGKGTIEGERRDGMWHWMPVEDVSIADGKGRGALLVGTDALQWSDGGGGRGGHGNGDQQRDGAKMSNEWTKNLASKTIVRCSP